MISLQYKTMPSIAKTYRLRIIHFTSIYRHNCIRRCYLEVDCSLLSSWCLIFRKIKSCSFIFPYSNFLYSFHISILYLNIIASNRCCNHHIICNFVKSIASKCYISSYKCIYACKLDISMSIINHYGIKLITYSAQRQNILFYNLCHTYLAIRRAYKNIVCICKNCLSYSNIFL